MDRESLKQRLKIMIVEECDKDVDPASITDDETLVGGALELDSLDALQISLAIKSAYGVRIEGGLKARAAFQSINTLADTILNEKNSLNENK